MSQNSGGILATIMAGIVTVSAIYVVLRNSRGFGQVAKGATAAYGTVGAGFQNDKGWPRG